MFGSAFYRTKTEQKPNKIDLLQPPPTRPKSSNPHSCAKKWRFRFFGPKVFFVFSFRKSGGLRRLATSPDRAEQRGAYGILETGAAAAPPNGSSCALETAFSKRKQIPACWGRPNASYSLLRADADSQAFTHTRVQLRTAATLCAAELQVSREIQAPELELRIFKLATSPNDLVTGWRKGRQLGLIQFLAEAGKSNGSVYTYAWAFRRGWGLDPEATPARHLQAINALKSFPPIIHLTDWEIGACPVLLAGTQTALSWGRIINYLYSFCRTFPQSCEFRREREPSSSDGEEAKAKKRKLKEVGSEGSELPK